jgi:hypothetical protein
MTVAHTADSARSHVVRVAIDAQWKANFKAASDTEREAMLRNGVPFVVDGKIKIVRVSPRTAASIPMFRNLW